MNKILSLVVLLVCINGCEPAPPKYVHITQPTVIPNDCFEVCVWIDTNSGNHCLDGEEFHRLKGSFRQTPQDAVKTRYPNHEIVSMKRGQREYLSTIYEVYWVTLKTEQKKD